MEVPKEYIWLGWLWVLLLVFHVSVFYYISVQLYRRNHYFKSIFFKLYLLHSVSNYGVVATMLLISPGVCFWYTSRVCGDIFMVIYYSMPFVQQFSYTAIACNRFSAIVLPLRHRSIWKPSTFTFLLALMVMLSLICAFVRLVLRTILLRLYDISFEKANKQAGWTRSGVNSVVYFLCFFVDAVLELWTFVTYHRLDFAGRRNHNDDYRLLVYTLLGMTMNSFLVTYYGMIALHIPYFEVLDIIAPIVIHLQALVGPAFLLLTSKTLRLGYLEFYGLRTPENTQATMFTTSSKSTAT